nr:zinc finger protein 883-like [Procambarus clarkii]
MKEIIQYGNMKGHRLLHAGIKPHECPECGKAFTQLGNMKTHRMRIHGRPVPGKTSSRAERMKTRLTVHTDHTSQEHTDHTSQEHTDHTSQEHTDHTSQEHTDHTSQEHTDHIVCGKTSSRAGRMKTRRTELKGLTSREVPECGKIFSQSTKTSDKPFECNEGGRRFRNRREIIDHIPVHSNERLYECSECGKTFKWRKNVTTHMVVHMGSSSTKPR